MENFPLNSIFLPDGEDFYSIYCEKCECLLKEPCWLHATIIKDEQVVPLAVASLPNVLYFGGSSDGSSLYRNREKKNCVYARTTLHPHTVFGPLTAPPRFHPEHSNSQQSGKALAFQMDNDNWCNWMKYISVVQNRDEWNMKMFSRGEDVMFVTVKIILPGEELKVAGREHEPGRRSDGSERTVFADMEYLQSYIMNSGDLINHDPAVDFASVKLESSANDHTGLPTSSCESGETSLPCWNESIPQCAVLKDESLPTCDAFENVFPLSKSETHSLVPSLPTSTGEEHPACTEILSHNDRESSPEYPFPPLRHPNTSTLIPHVKQKQKNLDKLIQSDSINRANDSCSAYLPIPESVEERQFIAPVTGIVAAASRIVNERQNPENDSRENAGTCFDHRVEVSARSYSLRPRATKRPFADYGSSKKQKQASIPVENALDEDMINDSDADADWRISNSDRDSSTESEELSDDASQSLTKKHKPVSKMIRKSTAGRSSTTPFVAVSNISLKTADEVFSAVVNTVSMSERHATVERETVEMNTPKGTNLQQGNGRLHRSLGGAHPSDVYRFVCPECSVHFVHDLLLQWHRHFQHSVAASDRWVPRRQCPACTSVCAYHYSMEWHVEEHAVKPEKIKHYIPTGDPCVLRFVPRPLPSDATLAEGPALNHETHQLCFMYCGVTCGGHQCTLRFCTEALMNLHEFKHRPPKDFQNELICPGCDYRAENLAMLVEHVTQHGAARKDRKMCRICGEFRVNMALHAAETHKEEHDKFLDVSFPESCNARCEECGKRFINAQRLSEHIKQGHNASFRCIICAKQFHTHNLRKNHVEEAHRTETGLECPICHESFQAYRAFRIHTKTHDVMSMRFCDVCQAVFYDNDKLARHKKIHEADYKYHCDQCGKSFKRAPNLSQHKKGVHTDFLKEKRKQRKEEMQKKGIVEKYVCPRRKMRYEEFPYKCEECKLGWLRLGGLEQHKMRKHVQL